MKSMIMKPSFELESLASSKRSKGTVSTASLTQASSHESTTATSKASSSGAKPEHSTSVPSESKAKAKAKRKKKKRRKTTKTKSSKVGGTKKIKTKIRNPPTKIANYLETIFRNAFQEFCDNRGKAEKLELVEIRLCFKDTTKKGKKTKGKKKSKKSSSAKDKSTKKARRRKKEKKTRASSKSTKKKTKSSKRKKSIARKRQKQKSSNPMDEHTLPSSFYNKNSATVAIMDHSSEAGSSDTPRVDNTFEGSFAGGSSQNHISLLDQASPEPGQRATISMNSGLSTKSPGLSLDEEDNDRDSIRPPQRPDPIDDKTRLEPPGTLQKSMSKREKLGMVIKKTLGALPAVPGHSQPSIKKSKKAKKKKKKKNSSISKKVKWKPLSEDSDGRRGRRRRRKKKQEEYCEDSDSDWAEEIYLESPKRKRKAKVSLNQWGVGGDQEPSETSEYGMSTYSGMAEAVAVEEESSSSNDGSMYLEGGISPSSHKVAVSQATKVQLNGDYVISEEEILPSSDEEMEEEYLSYSGEEESYYEEESWDEEEEYISPVEEDYVSPDEEELRQLEDAGAYVSPLVSPPNPLLKRHLGIVDYNAGDHSMALNIGYDDEEVHALPGPSQHSYYDEVNLSSNEQGNNASVSSSSTDSSSSSSSGSSSSSRTSSGSSSNGSYDSRQR